MPEENEKRIIILGGGFGGVRVGLDLAQRIDPKKAKVTLVNKTPHTEYHADFYEIAAQFLPENGTSRQKKIRFENLEGTVSVDLKQIFDRTNIEILLDEAVDLDLKNQEVYLVSGKKLKYYILVLALGSETNYFGIPHLEERSLPLKTVEDALNIRNQIDELFLRKNKNDEIRIVIGGGGFTGCELAGELTGYLNNLALFHNHDRVKVKISVVEACPNLLNGADKWIQDKAQKRLEKLGVELLLESKIINVELGKIILESKEKLPFDILIWTAGVKANLLVEKISGAKIEKNSCLAVDNYLRVVGFSNVFAIGDNSYCFDYEHNCFVPPTAQLAIAQGKIAAENIARIVNGQGMVQFKPKLPNFIVPIGKNYALGKAFGIRMEGILAWWLKRIVALKYFASILPFFTAFKLWWKGTQFFAK